MAERVLHAAAHPIRLWEIEIRISASIGMTFYPQSTPISADQLLRQADHAMYQAKLSGKNRYSVFDPELESTMQ